MKLNVLAVDGRVTRLAVEGKLIAAQGGTPLTPLGEMVAVRDGLVLLDLRRVDYINSAGISWLIQAHKQVADHGGRLVLHSLSAPVRQALDLVRLSTVLSIAPDESAALANAGR